MTHLQESGHVFPSQAGSLRKQHVSIAFCCARAYRPGVASTLALIAAELGISVATASRALNGKPGVSEDLRRRVLKVAGAQGYDPPQGRSAGNASGVIGVIVPELDNPVFPAFAQVMSTMLVQEGYAPMLCSQSAPGISEDKWVELLLANDVSGLIVVSGMHADTHASVDRYTRLRQHGVPFVLVNGHLDGVGGSSLSVDDVCAMDFGVQHLSALGHRRLGLAVGPARYTPVIRKVEGFTRALAARSALVDTTPSVEHSMFTLEGGYAAASRLLDAGVTGVLCASDIMALGAVKAARSRGLRVPEDVSVIGFDDAGFAAHTDPPLTTLRQPVRAMATAAVRALLETLRDGRHTDNEFLFTPELVVRASTSTAPGAPAWSGPATPSSQSRTQVVGAAGRSAGHTPADRRIAPVALRHAASAQKLATGPGTGATNLETPAEAAGCQ